MKRKFLVEIDREWLEKYWRLTIDGVPFAVVYAESEEEAVEKYRKRIPVVVVKEL